MTMTLYLSHVTKKPAFYIYENKGADQLCRYNKEADRLCGNQSAPMFYDVRRHLSQRGYI